MSGNQNQPDIQKVRLFSPEDRDKILNRILTILQADNRIAGVLVVGSGAAGFEDIYSDIDLCVVMELEKDVLSAFQEWGARIREMFPVFNYVESIRGANVYLWILLLDNFLEIDICFLCSSDLSARRERWKIAFDRSGKLEGIMRSSWENRPEPDIQSAYIYRVNSICYYITWAVVAVKRGLPWRALHELEQIRNQTVELRGLREGLETKHFRQVDKMSEEFLADIQQTLVLSTNAADIMDAVKVATKCFFREARSLDKMLGLNAASKLELKMREYLELFG